MKQRVLESLGRPENERYIRNFTQHEMKQRGLIHQIYTGRKEHAKMRKFEYLQVTPISDVVSEE